MALADVNRDLLDAAETRIRKCLETDLAGARRSGTRLIRQCLEDEDSLLRFDLRRLGTPHGRTPSASASDFQREIGVAPAEYLLRLKMEAAREWLRHPRLKI